MPIYEYICETCKSKFEAIEASYEERDITNLNCRKCGGVTRRVDFSIPASRDPRYGIQR